MWCADYGRISQQGCHTVMICLGRNNALKDTQRKCEKLILFKPPRQQCELEALGWISCFSSPWCVSSRNLFRNSTVNACYFVQILGICPFDTFSFSVAWDHCDPNIGVWESRYPEKAWSHFQAVRERRQVPVRVQRKGWVSQVLWSVMDWISGGEFVGGQRQAPRCRVQGKNHLELNCVSHIYSGPGQAVPTQ